MTWTLSTIVAEVFYCIIGLIFTLTGVKALKDAELKARYYTAAFWFILAFTFIAGPYIPKWIVGLCVICLLYTSCICGLHADQSFRREPDQSSRKGGLQRQFRQILVGAEPDQYRGCR